ncbi:MAG: acyltransferase [Clostridia bacterium]|nr:acyltransferase [Clostridia bacterium]
MAAKKRNINMEILRIIAMLMVVAGHRFGEGHGIIYSTSMQNINSANYYIYLGIFSFMVPVHLFFLISGYFLIDSDFKSKRVYNIWRPAFFYCVLLFFVSGGLRILFDRYTGRHLLLALGIAPEELSYRIQTWNDFFGNFKSFTSWLDGFFPVLRGRYGFVCCYIAMYLFSHYINKVLRSITKKQYQFLVAVCFLSFAVLPIIFHTDILKISDTSGIVWAMFMYIVAGYIKLHFDIKKYKPRTYMLAGLGFVLLRIISRAVTENLGVALGKDRPTWAWYLYGHDCFIPVMFAVFLMLYFLSFERAPKRSDKFIMWLSSVTFGVYLIHDNLMTRLFMWDLSIADRLRGSFWMWPAAFLDVAIIFIVFGALDYLRQLAFKAWDKKMSGTALVKKREALFAKIDSIFKTDNGEVR